MTTNFLNTQTRDVNVPACQLALLGFLAHKNFRDYEELLDFLHQTRQEILAKWFLDGDNSVLAKMQTTKLEIATADLARAIDQKGVDLNILPYNDNFFYESKTASQFNVVINEVARDLCESVKVLRFRPEYNSDLCSDNANALESHREDRFDSIVEVVACGKEYIAALYDTCFYSGYYAIPNAFKDHNLIGRCDDPDDFDNPDSCTPAVDEDAENPLVVKAIENLIAHEISKCTDHYIYAQALKDKSLIAIAKKISSLSHLSFEASAIIAANIRRTGMIYPDDLYRLEGALSEELPTSCSNADVAAIAALFVDATAKDRFSSDFSMPPIGAVAISY